MTNIKSLQEDNIKNSNSCFGAVDGINVVQITNRKKIDNNIFYDTDTIEYTNNGMRFWVKDNIDNGFVKELVYLDLIKKEITTEQSYKYNKSNVLAYRI